jgi:dUTP pyrophosphatase
MIEYISVLLIILNLLLIFKLLPDKSKFKLKIKFVSQSAKLPVYKTLGAAGLDLYSINEITVPAGGHTSIDTGVAIEIPPEYFGLVNIRSGLAIKYQLIGYPGIIDSDFRGSIHVILYNLGEADFVIKKNARFAQVVLIPYLPVEVVEVQVSKFNIILVYFNII